MEFIWYISFASAGALCLCLHFLLRYIAVSEFLKNGRNLPVPPPEAAGGWPLVGHLNLLSGPDKPHLKLSDLADKHGPIFSIRLGVRRYVIVSNWELAKEIYTTNDVVFSDKPRTAALQILGYDFALFVFSKYCPYWREMRKICSQKLLSNQKVSILGSLWESEIRALMKSIHDLSSNVKIPLEMKNCFEVLTLKLMVRIVAGSTEKKMDSGDGEKWRKEIREFFKMMGVLTFSDVVPFLKWMDYFVGTKRALKKTWKVMDAMLESWLEKHKELQKAKDLKVEEDFMDEMIGIADSISKEFPFYDADTISKATCQTMILGGTDSMNVTLTWALSLLLNNPHTLKRAQEEVDNHIGRSRKLERSDIENLPYIQAIIKETLRLHPPTLLTPPRESSTSCTVAGYRIPAGTRMIVNLWKLHRDPSVWSNPLEFKPERFLTENRDVDLRGQHFQFLPFGGGRRICPGISFAVQFMELVVASVLHGFDIETPTGEGVDMEVCLGAINAKATPLHVLLRPRLSSNLYV